MATTFKAFTNTVGASLSTIYTVPTGKKAIVIGCRLANNTTGSLTITAKAGGIYLIGKDTPLPYGSAFELADSGKIVLNQNETLQTGSSSVASLDVRLSVVELD